MELTNTNIRYLLTIYDLSKVRLEVSSKDIAQSLAVSRASVTSMMSILIDKRLVDKERYGKIHLTGPGQDGPVRGGGTEGGLCRRVSAAPPLLRVRLAGRCAGLTNTVPLSAAARRKFPAGGGFARLKFILRTGNHCAGHFV
ncbi:hypothetical protein [Flavonifractor sp. AGMB03687]|uniref:metal-dependent transcriptional regulator n=1 Tax=Flavonifractor sp. AGMB03687 TaxID=2785133 RepID=UPI001FD72D60|nr:hypothetical protein [Flavonifractor sp. AGMB03687]